MTCDIMFSELPYPKFVHGQLREQISYNLRRGRSRLKRQLLFGGIMRFSWGAGEKTFVSAFWRQGAGRTIVRLVSFRTAVGLRNEEQRRRLVEKLLLCLAIFFFFSPCNCVSGVVDINLKFMFFFVGGGGCFSIATLRKHWGKKCQAQWMFVSWPSIAWS